MIGYIYIRNFLWYSDSKLPKDKQPVLEKIIEKHLSIEDKENLMRTIAQKYREKGIQIGQEKGKLEGKLEIATSMLQKDYHIADSMLLTGLSRSHIEQLI
ncbi:MAG: hypothetical protein NQ127_02915 [Candidatus Cardinium sp.]|nr:hypothetical protein [Candidatus Cardinium sp.]